MNKTASILAAALCAAACASNEPKALVLYYSQTGTTKTVAEGIASLTGADIEAIDVTEPYSGTFDETVARCNAEMPAGIVPELIPLKADLSEYDVIYLGYPIWCGTYAQPVAALVKSGVLEGKTIVPFCTFGSGGLLESSADLKAKLPNSDIRDGYGIRTARIAAAPKELADFLARNGYIDGVFEVLPEFSEQKPVTKNEAAIFNEACGDYQFPLGTPVSCASRKTSDGTEYLFIATNAYGNAGSSAKIYVIAGKKDGSKAEFTRVD